MSQTNILFYTSVHYREQEGIGLETVVHLVQRHLIFFYMQRTRRPISTA